MPYQNHWRDTWRRHALIIFDAFPDVEVKDLPAANNEVAWSMRDKGIYYGVFPGPPGKVKTIECTSNELFLSENSELAEKWANSDGLSLMTRIGVLHETCLISMWLSEHQFWVGFSAGALITEIVLRIVWRR